MKCPRCNLENPPQGKFCQNCGYPLPQPSINFQQTTKKRRKPWYKRWWIWVIAGALTVSATGLVYGRRSDGSSAFENTKPTETIAETHSEHTTEHKGAYSTGETFDDDNLSIKYVSCGVYDCPPNASPDIGFEVIQANFEIQNNDSISRLIGEKYFKCYADNQPVDIWYSYDDGMHRFKYSEELSSGREFKGSLYFEVPDDALTIEIEYQPIGGLFDNPKPVVFKVR